MGWHRRRPIRAVSPPPARATTNQVPVLKTFELSERTATYDPSNGSAAGVFASDDYQSTLAISTGAFPPLPGADGALITMTPLAPMSRIALPHGYKIAENVVLISASYSPAGGSISKLSANAQLTLAYPRVSAAPSTILTSVNGRRWFTVPSGDRLAQQLVVASIHKLGFFAVGQKAVGGGVGFEGDGPLLTHASSSLAPVLVLAGLVFAALVVVLVMRAREQKNGRT